MLDGFVELIRLQRLHSFAAFFLRFRRKNDAHWRSVGGARCRIRLQSNDNDLLPMASYNLGLGLRFGVSCSFHVDRILTFVERSENCLRSERRLGSDRLAGKISQRHHRHRIESRSVWQTHLHRQAAVVDGFQSRVRVKPTGPAAGNHLRETICWRSEENQKQNTCEQGEPTSPEHLTSPSQLGHSEGMPQEL